MTANIFKTRESNTKRKIRRLKESGNHTKDSSLKFVSDMKLREAESNSSIMFHIKIIFHSVPICLTIKVVFFFK